MNATSVVIRRHGDPSVLSLESAPAPAPAAGQVLIETEVAGVAYADVLMRLGIYPEMPALPFTPGYDLVGRVAATGPGFADLAIGTRVAAMTVSGGYSTHVLASAALTVPVPEDLPAASVVALVLNYVTAWQMLHRVAAVREGQRILVLGAAGGVGSALLELAAIAGIAAIGTASGARTEAVTRRGATAIDRQRQDVNAEVAQFAPGGVAAAFDPVGGPGLLATRKLVDRHGTLVSYGYSFAADDGLSRTSAMTRQGLVLARTKVTPGAKTQLYAIAGKRGWAAKHPDHFGIDLTELMTLLAQGRLAPEVSTVPISDVAAAHEALESGRVTGKLVLQTVSP